MAAALLPTHERSTHRGARTQELGGPVMAFSRGEGEYEEPGGRMRRQPIEQLSSGKGCPWFGGCGNSHGQVTVPLFVSVRQCDQVVLQQRINSGKSQCGLIDKAPHS